MSDVVIVKSQSGWDALPESFLKFTVIEIRSSERINIHRVPDYSRATLRDNSTATLWNNSTATLRDNSKAELWDNSKAELRDNSTAELWDNSKAELWGNSRAELWDNSRAELRGNSRAELWDNSRAELRDNSRAELRDNSRAELRDNSRAELFGFSLCHVFSETAAIDQVRDFSVVSQRGVKCLIGNVDATVTVIDVPEKYEVSFDTWLSRGYVSADGIIRKLKSRKKLGSIDVFTVEEDFGRSESFVVREGEDFSHGETLKDAIEDLRYKVSSRDPSEFKLWGLDTEVSLDDAVRSYRVITGACRLGTRAFLESIQAPERLTIREVIEKTKGKYRSEAYERFFNE